MNSIEALNQAHKEGNARDIRFAMEGETASIPDMLASLSAPANYEKAECVVKMLNAFIHSKMKVTNSPDFTVDDLRAFSVAVRALGTSWEIATASQERLSGRQGLRTAAGN